MQPLVYLKEILHPKVCVPGDTANPEWTVVILKEDSLPQSNQIRLHLPPESIVFRLDVQKNNYFKLKSPFLNNTTEKLHGGCDYVVFCSYKGKYWFVLIELKSKDTTGAVTQLCCSSAFVRYLREIIFTHDGNNVKYRMVNILFSTAPRFELKQGTRMGRREYSTSYAATHNLSYYGLPYVDNFSLIRLLDCESQTDSIPDVDLFNSRRCTSPIEP